MAGFNRFGFMAIAVVFHIVYIFSIFDVYFVSPIVSGMRHFKVERPEAAKAPADRLVLFVGDGLRADKAFQQHPEPYPESDEDLVPRHLAPFLRSRVLEHGTFGVSHTRVPTESRPGHVALIAGLYEDVSAVATGWKMNPVNFDSVFNRSRHTWSWGSPDILPMFHYGAVPGRVNAFWYESEFEDFSKDATELDYWVFDHVKDFFAEAAKNETLNAALREDKVVFFLHLLGLDTSGHAYRPYSKEYLNNLKVVDQGVKEITELIQNFYADDRTAFVFTADHGMTDWGSHGDGHPDNTRTPLISWGSGVAPPELYPNSVAPGHDEYSADWGLDHVRRHDVAQADVAALMSYLIGAEFPANGVGELPLEFLSATPKEKAEASLVNAQVILEQYRVKEEKKRATELRYRPYGPLSEENLSPEDRTGHIRALIQAGQYEEAIEESDVLITVGLQGLRYLQTYDWLFLRALITIGYLGWIAYALTTVLSLYVLQHSVPSQRNPLGFFFFSSILVGLYASFIVSKSPPSYYLYTFFPVLFWEEVYARRNSISQGCQALFGHIKSGGAVAALIFNIVLYIGVIQSLALGYIHREILTGLFVLAAFWPLTCGISFFRSHAFLSLLWFLSCLAMSTFTLLPAMKVENIPLILVGGGLMVLVGLAYLILEDVLLSNSSSSKTKPKPLHGNRTALGAQIGLIILSMIVTRSSAMSLQAKLGLPRGNQVVGWFILVTSFLMPLAYQLQPNNHYMHRLVVIFLTCAPTFVILTISYESLFYVAFSITLLAWVRLEYAYQTFTQSKAKQEGIVAEQQKRDSGPFRPLALSDARISLFFMVLLQSAFFSTGNVASVAQFSLESVNRLFPIFDPVSQGALLTLKLMIPFVLISANLGVLNKRLGVAPSALFMVVLAASDILTLYFFWVVKDEGSWLEIGSTISHFAIASGLCVFVAALEGVSAVFIAGIEIEDEEQATTNGEPVSSPKTNGKASSTVKAE
ncbi:GPI ethanolamine phosphate transferase 1 [Fusarium duplospermum]|uniref:GPI ethanolamine phosphate transferase 1 n=1 Tax=Fusarium duplospermum TaxID=1325734 RepID=A0A428R703_9HYPO|nr:GPI ethanolamine phosphate transferase 1 [Fusarium duplospermum]